MKMILKRLLSLLICLSFLAGNLPAVYAEEAESQETGQFALAVLTADGVVIEPTYIIYAPGQTVAQALLSSPYEFVGLLDDPETSGWIEEIEGVSASYSLFYDDNGYDLTEPADSITALCVTEKADNYSEEYLSLIKTMADYNSSENGVDTYEAAENAYEKALTDLYTATPAYAVELATALEKAMEDYEKFISGETVVLTLDVPGVTVGALYDRFGNTYPVTEETEYLLPPGVYEFDLGDGDRSYIRGSIAVEEDTTLTAELPDGQWLEYMDLSIVPDNNVTMTVWKPVEKLDDWTFAVPDYANASLYPWFEPAEGVDTSKCGMYLGEGSKRVWRSHQTVLARVIEGNSMEGRELVFEARQEYGDYEQYQTYPVTIVRVPSLSSLAVYSEGTRLPIDFSPEIKEYTLTTTGDSVDLYMGTLISDGITIEVDGEGLSENTCNVALAEEFTDIEIDVYHENGLSSSYTLTVEKLGSVDVAIETNADDVQVFNAAGAEIAPVDGVYGLIPGASYTYVTTTGDYFHTSGEFVAAEDLIVNAPVEEIRDGLSALKIAATLKADPFDATPEFEPGEHEYVYQVGSNETSFGIMAAMDTELEADGYSIAAIYSNWNTGEAVEKAVSGKYTSCVMFLSVSGKPNTMTLRIGREVDGVKYYQDYILTAQRRLQLNDMSLLSNGQGLVLNQADTGKTGFSKFVTEYTAEVGQTVPEITLNLKLFSTAAGNDKDVDVTVFCGDQSFTLDYADLAAEQIQTMQIPLNVDKQEETVEITLDREGATSQTYTVAFEKLPPIETTITPEPGDALVHLTDDVTGLRVLAEEDGSFILSTGRSYTYIVTQHGYKTKSASFVAGEANEELAITLEKAPENSLVDISLDTDYLSFRGNANNNGITNALTPTAAEDTVLNWANKIGEGMQNGGVGSPIIVGGDLYSYAGSTVFRIDKDTGEVLASGPMDHASSFSITPPAYGEGMIFVALANGGIQAFHAQTLESLWVYSDPMGGQPNCPVVYKDGYVYTGFWNAEEKRANFVCICVTDEEPTQAKEVKLASWSYTHNGFYWAGAYVSENFLLVTTDDGANGYTSANGSILSIDPKTGLLLDELVMPNVGDLRSSVCYDEETDAYYFTSKGGDFYRIEVNAEGTFAEYSLNQLHLDNGTNSEKNPPMSTSTPVVYNGRAYIGVSGTGQFVSYSGHNITVIDLNNWKIAYTVPTQGYPQTSGLLTTAYEGDREYVYIYFLDNYTPGKLRVIRDTAGQNSFDTSYATKETYTKSGKSYTVDTGYVLFTPSGAQSQYAICSPIVDEYGNIYFKNDSGFLMCVGSTIEELVIEQEPEKLVYEVGQVFDPKGMKVTAVYANGMERDMSRFAFASADPLTVDDIEMTVSVDLGKHQMMYQNKDGEVGVEYYLPTTTLDLTINSEHTWDDGTVNQEATCVDAGEMVYVCPVCRGQKKEPIPANGLHAWDAGSVTTQPTATQDGVKTYCCTVCEATKTESVPATGEHQWDEGKVTQVPSCTEKGCRTYTCTVCGETKTVEIPATGAHTWDSGKVVREASVIAEGEKQFTCTVCGEERSEKIPVAEPCSGNNCPGQGFVDWVEPGHWAHDGMDYAVSRSLMNGVGEGLFDPNGELTRAMLVTILWRYAGAEDVGFSTFTDVSQDAWYAKSVAWAAKYGIVNGLGGNSFGPDVKITREQIATILYRYAAYLKLDTSMKGDFSAFADGEKVSSWAVEAMQWATASGVLNGSADNGKIYLNPGNNATRAQASKLFMSYIELILK